MFTEQDAIAAASKLLERLKSDASGPLSLAVALSDQVATLRAELSAAPGGDVELYAKVRQQVADEAARNTPVAPHGAFANLKVTP